MESSFEKRWKAQQEALGVQFVPYDENGDEIPLEQLGVITTDNFKAEDEPVLLEDPVIKTIAERHQATPAQVLISWALHRDTAVIPKSVNPERLGQNLAAADLRLSDDDLNEIADLDRHRRYVDGAFWAQEGSPYTLATLWDE